MKQTGVVFFVLQLLVFAGGQQSRTSFKDVKSSIRSWQNDILQSYKEYRDKENADMKEVLKSTTKRILNNSSDDLKRNLEDVNYLCRKFLTIIQESASIDNPPVLNPPPRFRLGTRKLNSEHELDRRLAEFRNSFDNLYFIQWQEMGKSYRWIRKYVNHIYVASLPFVLEELNKINHKYFSMRTIQALPDTWKELRRVSADIQAAYNFHFSQAGLKNK